VRNVPQLVFRHDSLTSQQQQLEDAFRRMDEEVEEEAEAGEDGPQAEGRPDHLPEQQQQPLHAG
jgi:hypothetical protein